MLRKKGRNQQRTQLVMDTWLSQKARTTSNKKTIARTTAIGKAQQQEMNVGNGANYAPK